jgi:hypothetical protein
MLAGHTSSASRSRGFLFPDPSAEKPTSLGVAQVPLLTRHRSPQAG